MVEQFDTWVLGLGAAGYLLLCLAALIEHVAPPFPGDTIVLLGGAYAVRGERSWWLVLLAVTVGSMVGLSIDYAVGRLVASRLERRRDDETFLRISMRKLRNVQEAVRVKGAWLLVVNRFLPTFRATLYFVAGAAQMPYRQVLTLGTISAILWNSVLIVVGMVLGHNAEAIESFLRNYRLAALLIVGVAAMGLLARWLASRGRQPKPDAGAEPTSSLKER